mmetsp:Transcript_39206/g.92304  ORF Transcript_39206/g.92304 Transcript_39206/m.92304 type:complete len:1060 (-) Transcript_39206:61-3240(-)
MKSQEASRPPLGKSSLRQWVLGVFAGVLSAFLFAHLFIFDLQGTTAFDGSLRVSNERTLRRPNDLSGISGSNLTFLDNLPRPTLVPPDWDMRSDDDRMDDEELEDEDLDEKATAYHMAVLVSPGNNWPALRVALQSACITQCKTYAKNTWMHVGFAASFSQGRSFVSSLLKLWATRVPKLRCNMMVHQLNGTGTTSELLDAVYAVQGVNMVLLVDGAMLFEGQDILAKMLLTCSRALQPGLEASRPAVGCAGWNVVEGPSDMLALKLSRWNRLRSGLDGTASLNKALSVAENSTSLAQFIHACMRLPRFRHRHVVLGTLWLPIPPASCKSQRVVQMWSEDTAWPEDPGDQQCTELLDSKASSAKDCDGRSACSWWKLCRDGDDCKGISREVRKLRHPTPLPSSFHIAFPVTDDASLRLLPVAMLSACHASLSPGSTFLHVFGNHSATGRMDELHGLWQGDSLPCTLTTHPLTSSSKDWMPKSDKVKMGIDNLDSFVLHLRMLGFLSRDNAGLVLILSPRAFFEGWGLVQKVFSACQGSSRSPGYQAACILSRQVGNASSSIKAIEDWALLINTSRWEKRECDKALSRFVQNLGNPHPGTHLDVLSKFFLSNTAPHTCSAVHVHGILSDLGTTPCTSRIVLFDEMLLGSYWKDGSNRCGWSSNMAVPPLQSRSASRCERRAYCEWLRSYQELWRWPLLNRMARAHLPPHLSLPLAAAGMAAPPGQLDAGVQHAGFIHSDEEFRTAFIVAAFSLCVTAKKTGQLHIHVLGRTADTWKLSSLRHKWLKEGMPCALHTYSLSKVTVNWNPLLRLDKVKVSKANEFNFLQHSHLPAVLGEHGVEIALRLDPDIVVEGFAPGEHILERCALDMLRGKRRALACASTTSTGWGVGSWVVNCSEWFQNRLDLKIMKFFKEREHVSGVKDLLNDFLEKSQAGRVYEVVRFPGASQVQPSTSPCYSRISHFIGRKPWQMEWGTILEKGTGLCLAEDSLTSRIGAKGASRCEKLALCHWLHVFTWALSWNLFSAEVLEDPAEDLLFWVAPPWPQLTVDKTFDRGGLWSKD